MARWFRRDKVTNEAGDYLRATDNVSRPMAILLTLLTIVILAALLFTVFWGVKWAYDRIWGEDSTTTTVVETPSSGSNEDQPQEFPGFVSPEEANDAGSTPQNTQATTPATIPNTGPGDE